MRMTTLDPARLEPFRVSDTPPSQKHWAQKHPPSPIVWLNQFFAYTHPPICLLKQSQLQLTQPSFGKYPQIERDQNVNLSITNLIVSSDPGLHSHSTTKAQTFGQKLGGRGIQRHKGWRKRSFGSRLPWPAAPLKLARAFKRNIYIYVCCFYMYIYLFFKSPRNAINIGIKLEMMEILSNQNVKDINRNDI